MKFYNNLTHLLSCFYIVLGLNSSIIECSLDVLCCPCTVSAHVVPNEVQYQKHRPFEKHEVEL